MAEKIIQLDSVDTYNKLYGWETIAYQLGFEYPQHFSRLFKQVTKKTPLLFKEDFTRDFSS